MAGFPSESRFMIVMDVTFIIIQVEDEHFSYSKQIENLHIFWTPSYRTSRDQGSVGPWETASPGATVWWRRAHLKPGRMGGRMKLWEWWAGARPSENGSQS